MRGAEDLLIAFGFLCQGDLVLDEIISDAVIEHPLQLDDNSGRLGVLVLDGSLGGGIGLLREDGPLGRKILLAGDLSDRVLEVPA